jgi:GntR family transcriptional regulator, transcriptional repressor for pyruvate dehydrogenase complex
MYDAAMPRNLASIPGARGGPANAGDVIAGALAEQVLSGEIAAGERLPSERRLATGFGASRPMVREALRSLVERGLIEVRPGRGAFVRDDPGPRRFQPLDVEYRRRGTTARQLSETRIMLESEAAALAAVRADADDLMILETALKSLETSPTPLDRVRDDLAFHAAIVRASHNPVIETMFASIQALTVELMVRSAGDPEIIRQSDPFHRVAFEAIRGRDADAARAAIRAHLGIAASTYGDDYDRSLDTTAARALSLIGSGAGLDEFLRGILPDAGSPAATIDIDHRPGDEASVPGHEI